MKPEYVSLISGFAGALIGGAVSVVTMWLQQHFQSRRDTARLASEIALRDYEHALELARARGKGGRKVTSYPVTLYIAYHTKLLDLIQRRKLTPETLREMTEYSDSIMNEIKSLEKKTEQLPTDEPPGNAG